MAMVSRRAELMFVCFVGGDINITDSDGDTPLYTVESVEVAQYLVGKGAIVDRQNLEGISVSLQSSRSRSSTQLFSCSQSNTSQKTSQMSQTT